MHTLFEILKWLFFIVSFIIWIFFLRWNYIMPNDKFITLSQILLPWYLVIIWLMVWYVLWNFLIIKNEIDDVNSRTKIYIRSLLVWIIIWIILAWIYIFFKTN
jgi:hypothetical protein